MFIPAFVLEWRGDFPEKRVRDFVHGDRYALNTNRMYEITEAYDGNPTMFFFDNPWDARERGARLKITDETIASIKVYADMDHGSETYALAIFPENDITQTPVDTTLSKSDIAYMYPYGDGTSYTWVCYAIKGWDMVRVLVNEAYGDLWNNLNTI